MAAMRERAKPGQGRFPHIAREAACNMPRDALAKLKTGCAWDDRFAEARNEAAADFWTIWRQGQPDDVCKNANRCIMAAQFGPDMVNITLRQGGELMLSGVISLLMVNAGARGIISRLESRQ
jgi:hypothetical protein